MKAAFSIVFLICISAVLSARVFPMRKSFIEKPAFRRSYGNQKIVGGEEAVPHSIPFQVGLFLDGHFCGGSLITKRHVLTAGHCGVLTNSPQVVLGAHKIQSNEETQVIITGSKVTVHENYDEADNLRNDIAIIELPQEAELNENIQTVAVASSDIGDLVGETAQVSGWGLTHDSDATIAPALRFVNSTLLSNQECQKEFGSGISVFDTVVCLDGKQGKSSCNGDSGGPLVIKTANGEIIEVGLTSYGIIWGCELNYPSAFTRISSYADWIATNTR